MFNFTRLAATSALGGLSSVVLKKQDVLNTLTLHAADNKELCYVGDIIKRRVGFPQPTACCKPLRFKDFIVSYDSKNRIPNWVYEHLQYDKLFKDDPCDRRIKVDRTQCASNEDKERPKFTPDCRIHGYHRADAKDYCDTEYEMGLMAQPENYPYDQESFCECFTMTNIVPQVPGFNCGPWFDLECYVREKLVRENKGVYVCSGPLFLPCAEDDRTVKQFDVLGDGEVSVPTHFFKVIVIETQDGQLELESYMMPNCTPEEGEEVKLEDFLTPLCQIEHHSGLIFFPEKKCFSSNNRRRGARLHAL
ncbi:hypothetical protein RRG08_033327 [Elysia crispata]|uniref:Uncharacterized protein n=1 Tax=Elysia crispata TaxID=231223 RepID=A0AAE0XN14_9GAST|nr:hypothetical protein RRG08_033327 [Elysia crispata]